MIIESIGLTGKEWIFYREQLAAIKTQMMGFEWSYFVTIRRGAGGVLKAFTGQGDKGYKKRKEYTDKFFFELRKKLKVDKENLHYYAVHEFGEDGFGHVHAVFHFNKELSEFAVESVLRELAEAERKEGYLIHYTPPEKYEMKHPADIKIRSKEDVCSYMTKVEKVRGCYYPLSKQHWHSNFLVKR